VNPESPTPAPASVDEITSTLKELIRTCRDGENGFRTAAADIQDPNLKHLFESYSQQRSEFASELQEELQRHAEEPVDSGHASATLHRSLMAVEATLTGRDEGTIISECERGEDQAVEAYEAALRTLLPDGVRSLVERQFLRIREAHDQIRSLQRAYERHS
jgi:uncharacterized protein (TIGR02284 family)